MARGSAFEKKRKRDCESTPVAGGGTGQTAKRRRKQVVVDSDDDDGSSVFQPSSPVPSSSRRYAKPAPKPSAQVASSFIAKRRGRPEEIDLEDSDEDLPSVATIFASSQSEKRSSQPTASSSARRQTRRSAVETPPRKGKGTIKAPYRRPTGTLVNLGTFELDEDGNDVEELKRKREARKRRREESRRRKEGSDDDSVIECSPQAQKRASPTKPTQQEVIVIDSDEGGVPPPAPKRARRSSPTPRPRSPSPPMEPPPPSLEDPEAEPSLEILSHPSPPRPDDSEPEAEPVTYEPGELQALYEEEFQKIIDRTQDIATIVPRRKHKVFRSVPSMDPVCLNPTYTRDYSGASAIVTRLLWSRSDPYWLSVDMTSSTKVGEDNDVMAFAEDVDNLAPSSRTGGETRDEPEPEPNDDLGPREDNSQVDARPQDTFEERPRTAADPDPALESLATEDVPVLDAPPGKSAPEIIHVPDESPPQDASTTQEDSTSSPPSLRSTRPPISTGNILVRSLSVDSSPTAATPSDDLPSYGHDPLSLDKVDDAIIGDGIAAAMEAHKSIAGREKGESSTRKVLLELTKMLKAEHARNSESSRPASSSRQSSATLASQSSDETELSSPGPVTPVHPVGVDPVANLSGEGGICITTLKREDDVDSLMDDDDSISIAGSSLELAYPD